MFQLRGVTSITIGCMIVWLISSPPSVYPHYRTSSTMVSEGVGVGEGVGECLCVYE